MLTVLRAFFAGDKGDERVIAWARSQVHVLAEFDAIRSGGTPTP